MKKLNYWTIDDWFAMLVKLMITALSLIIVILVALIVNVIAGCI